MSSLRVAGVCPQLTAALTPRKDVRVQSSRALGPSVTLEVIHRGAGNAVGVLDGRALIVVRSQALTEETLDAIVRAVEQTRAARPAGALAIIPGDAGLSPEHLLARQRKIFQQAKKLDDVWIAFCVQGDGVQSMVMRAVVRMFLLGQPRMTMHAKPESAIVWFATRLGLSVEAVRSAVASLRTSPT